MAKKGKSISAWKVGTQGLQEVFKIPRTRDKVLVRKCELTLRQARNVCNALLMWLDQEGLAVE